MRKVLVVFCLVAAAGCSNSPEKSNVSNNTTSTNQNNNTTSTNQNNTTSTNQNNTTANNLNNQEPTTDPSLIDILWVLDNSGSMCQEQATLRENFELFAAELAESGVDFRLGITTTDTNPDYALEPIARPGELQATPQPVPGFDRSCHSATDESGQPIPGDFTPIRETIATAVNCMATPDESFNQVSDADIECALYASPSGCSIARAGCEGNCAPEHLFPAPSSYRPVPKVLRSEDYMNGSTLDVERLKSDFACASLVGTRGYGIEKGLEAAVLAVSPDKTGGAADGGSANPSAPNHGLIRANARFGLIFVTDENDCSHDGSLAEDTACGGDVCEFANAEGADSPLIEPSTVADDLMANLRESKGKPELTRADVFVASLHGNYRRFSGEVPTDSQCISGSYEGISPTCASTLGIAYSGDRYERFLRQFPADQYYPQANPSNPDANLTGWMCTGDFRPALEAVGQFFGSP